MQISQKAKIVMASLAIVAAGVTAAVPVSAAGYKYDAASKKCVVDDAATPAYASASACAAANTGATVTCAKADTECYAAFAGEGTGNTSNLMGILQGILNAVFGVVGFISVVMLVYGGIQYTISSGDAGKVKKAKDTILYGIVGLIISLLAAAIVNFVLVNVLK